MDQTNYPLLSIVAIVAITAIVAIFLFARADGLTPPGEAATGLFSVEITGRVTASPIHAVSPEGNRIDLNDDGSLTAADAEILGAVIDRAQFCPRNKRCDLNTDGRIDVNDLGLLNSEILKTKPSAYVPTPVAQNDDAALSVGAFGGIA
jgi:hypothetical protein